jgi:accessory colonization factor AcfC
MQTTTMLLTQYAQAAQVAARAAQAAARANTLAQAAAQAIANNAAAAQQATQQVNDIDAYLVLYNYAKELFEQQHFVIAEDEGLLLDALLDEML